MSLTSVAIIGLLLSRTLYLSAAFMFLLGFATVGRLIVGFVYVMEFLTPKQQVVIGTLFSLLEALCQINTALYFKFISQNYFWYALTGLVFSLVSVLGTLIFVDESLLFLLKTNKIVEANKGLERMQRINKENQEVLDDTRSDTLSIRSSHTLHYSLLKPKTMFKKYEIPPSDR